MELSDFTTWSRDFQDRVNERISMVKQTFDERMEHIKSNFNQRMESSAAISDEKYKNLVIRVQEGLSESREHRDMLLQQIDIIGEEIKATNKRLEEFAISKGECQIENEAVISNMSKIIQGLDRALTAAQLSIAALEKDSLILKSVSEAKKNDNIRAFLGTLLKRVLLFLAGGLGIFVLKNLPDLISLISG